MTTNDRPEAGAAAPPCRFWVRGEDESPLDIRQCGRPPEQHPVTGMGRFENHENWLPTPPPRCEWVRVGQGYCGQPATHVRYDHYRDDQETRLCKYHVGVARRDGWRDIYKLPR